MVGFCLDVPLVSHQTSGMFRNHLVQPYCSFSLFLISAASASSCGFIRAYSDLVRRLQNAENASRPRSADICASSSFDGGEMRDCAVGVSLAIVIIPSSA